MAEEIREECRTCNGTGEIELDDDTEIACPTCGGFGWVPIGDEDFFLHRWAI